MESAGSEIRLYRASGAGLVELARLSGVAPPRAVEGDLRAPEIGDNYGDGDAAGAGLFVALVQGRVIVDIARLLFVGGEPSDPDGGPDCYSGSNRSSSGDKPGSSGSTGEEEEEENAKGHVRSSSWRSATEDSVSNFLEQQVEEGSSSKNPLRITSNFWRSGSSESSTEEEGQSQELHQEGEEDWVFDDKDHLSDGTRSLSNSPRQAANESSGNHFNEALSSKKRVQASSGECDSITDERGQDPEKDNKKEEKDAFQSIQIRLKLWPAQRHLLIKFFSGGKWVLTKDCILTWLNLEDVNEYNLKVEFGASFATVLGFRNTDCTMDFEVDADCTPMLNDLMTLLKTSICNFQILKKVGEGGACKVFKCLFMGRKCALKSLTQENPWTLEPRHG